LRRTRCGPFRIEECYPLEQLESIATGGGTLPVIAPAAALPDWPALQVHEGARNRLANGVAPAFAEVGGHDDLIAGRPVRLLIGSELAAIARFAPGGEGGRPGDFVLDKVFPDAIALP
jgi:tRNA U55 pseudouridine synthase TruB